MRNRTRVAPAIIILLLGALTLTLVSCKGTAATSSRKKSSPKVKAVASATMKPIPTREEAPFFSQKSDAMKAFFTAFFSGNFESAYKTTSVSFKAAHPFEDIKKEWSEFYGLTTKAGMTKKSLSFRTNFHEYSGDSGGIIVSSSGRLIAHISYKQLEEQKWKIDDIELFKKSLSAKLPNGKKRTVLTDQSDNKIYKEINELLVKQVAVSSGLKPTEVSVRRLVVSGDWAHAVLGVNNPKYEFEQVVLQQVDSKWKIVNQGSDIKYDDYPESPYTLWAADDYK